MKKMSVFDINEGNKYYLRNPIITRLSTTYDCIYFGSYPQTDVTGKSADPIKWRVLAVNGDYAFLIADQILDMKKYNMTSGDVIWENCTLRSWLNGYNGKYNICNFDYASDNFLNQAFTSKEQVAIPAIDDDEITVLTTDYKPDKVFLLSFCEASHVPFGFSSDYATILVG